jgi:hypothetical protein
MPLSNIIDVANSGTRPGYPLRCGGMTMSALPTGPMARREENIYIPPISASGLAVKYTDRFDNRNYYST